MIKVLSLLFPRPQASETENELAKFAPSRSSFMPSLLYILPKFLYVELAFGCNYRLVI